MTRCENHPCDCPCDRGYFTLILGDDTIHYGHSFQNAPAGYHVLSGGRPEEYIELGITPVQSFYPGGAGSKSKWYHIVTCEQYNRLLARTALSPVKMENGHVSCRVCFGRVPVSPNGDHFTGTCGKCGTRNDIPNDKLEATA